MTSKRTMKRHFVTGLIILLPLVITLAIVGLIVNFFTKPFIGLSEYFLNKTSWYAAHYALVNFLLKVILILILFFFTVLLGYLARLLVFKSMLTFYDYLMHRIPFIKTVYKAIQQVIRAILGSSERSFKQVVMVPFPVRGSYAIGLISSPAPSICEKTLECELVSVFVATTPNPTSGYLMMYKKEEVIYLDMKVEDALKYIISCGVITTDTPEKSFSYHPDEIQ